MWLAAISVVLAFVTWHSLDLKHLDGLPRYLVAGGLMTIAIGWLLIDQGIMFTVPMVIGTFAFASGWFVRSGRHRAEKSIRELEEYTRKRRR